MKLPSNYYNLPPDERKRQLERIYDEYERAQEALKSEHRKKIDSVDTTLTNLQDAANYFDTEIGNLEMAIGNLQGEVSTMQSYRTENNGVALSSVSGNDWNNCDTTGFYVGSGYANQTPYKTHTGQYTVHIKHNATNAAQIAMGFESSNPKLSIRLKNSGAWGPWTLLNNTGGTGGVSGVYNITSNLYAVVYSTGQTITLSGPSAYAMLQQAEDGAWLCYLDLSFNCSAQTHIKIGITGLTFEGYQAISATGWEGTINTILTASPWSGTNYMRVVSPVSYGYHINGWARLNAEPTWA